MVVQAQFLPLYVALGLSLYGNESLVYWVNSQEQQFHSRGTHDVMVFWTKNNWTSSSPALSSQRYFACCEVNDLSGSNSERQSSVGVNTHAL